MYDIHIYSYDCILCSIVYDTSKCVGCKAFYLTADNKAKFKFFPSAEPFVVPAECTRALIRTWVGKCIAQSSIVINEK